MRLALTPRWRSNCFLGRCFCTPCAAEPSSGQVAEIVGGCERAGVYPGHARATAVQQNKSHITDSIIIQAAACRTHGTAQGTQLWLALQCNGDDEHPRICLVVSTAQRHIKATFISVSGLLIARKDLPGCAVLRCGVRTSCANPGRAACSLLDCAAWWCGSSGMNQPQTQCVCWIRLKNARSDGLAVCTSPGPALKQTDPAPGHCRFSLLPLLLLFFWFPISETVSGPSSMDTARDRLSVLAGQLVEDGEGAHGAWQHDPGSPGHRSPAAAGPAAAVMLNHCHAPLLLLLLSFMLS